MINFNLSNHY